MGKREDGFVTTVRKEVVRVLLEKVQGDSLKRSMEGNYSPLDENALPYEVEEMLNRPYMNRQEVPLAMDIFKPKTEKGKELPVIVTIHGGGLVLGDRKMHRRYAKILAGHGYLVFCIEYRLAPRANVAEQLDDVCAGMDLVGRTLVDFDVDFTRVFLTAESAGAFLATYVAAMKESEALQKAVGYEPSNVRFKALGLISGMFYTQKRDLIGHFLAEQFYGDKMSDTDFLELMNPEHKEILGNLPPVFLVTSRGDFLNNYTLMFHDALKKAGKRTHLVYYGEKELGHAFVTMQPGNEKSVDAIERMLKWFEESAKNTDPEETIHTDKDAPLPVHVRNVRQRRNRRDRDRGRSRGRSRGCF
jgi:acetyl esterase/lipase